MVRCPTPIYQTSTFEVTDNDEQLRTTGSDHFYTRYGNPTNTVAEKTVAALEGVDAALTFSSGMGAITTTTHGAAEERRPCLWRSAIFTAA